MNFPLAVLVAVAACDSDPAASGLDTSMDVVVGEYEATRDFGVLSFTTIQDGLVTDWLALGADLQLDLSADGTMDGRLFAPGADEDGGDIDEDMHGLWSLNGSTVRFDQEADTFVRDVPFTWNAGALTGEHTFGDVLVRVVLVRR